MSAKLDVTNFEIDMSPYNFLSKLKNNSAYRRQFIALIKNTSYNRCYVEFDRIDSTTCKTEPTTRFVVVKTDKHFDTADWTAFRDQLSSRSDNGSSVKSFYNLARDTLLVVPVPTNNIEIDIHSGHIMNFLMKGDASQIDTFIRTVASEALKLLGSGWKHLWMSTHGHGVSWLHWRLSPSPKYYSYKLF